MEWAKGGGGGGQVPPHFSLFSEKVVNIITIYSTRFRAPQPRLGTFKGCTGLKMTSKNAVGNEPDSFHVLSPGNHRAL